VARGRTLLLLNSDVIPAESGWLSALHEAYLDRPDCGAVAPRLLYPDGSLQHGGISFAEHPGFPGVWINKHPGKGLPPKAEPSGDLFEVPAVSGACLMVSRQLFDMAGGMDEDYIVGDFEDTDFCLKLRAFGKTNYMAPGIELYHLERQSQALDGDRTWRTSLTMYNAWTHSQRWSGAIEELTEQAGE